MEPDRQEEPYRQEEPDKQEKPGRQEEPDRQEEPERQGESIIPDGGTGGTEEAQMEDRMEGQEEPRRPCGGQEEPRQMEGPLLLQMEGQEQQTDGTETDGGTAPVPDGGTRGNERGETDRSNRFWSRSSMLVLRLSN